MSDIAPISAAHFGGRSVIDGQSFDLGINITIAQLGHINRTPDHPAKELIPGNCSVCQCELEVIRLFQALTACDACRAKSDHDEALKRAEKHWKAMCPPAYRETSKEHPDFPKGAFATLNDWKGQQSLFLYGPSRAGKTRAAMLLLKRAMLKGHHVGVLWPEQLKAVKFARDNLETMNKLAMYDVLLLDDALLTGAANDSISEYLKDLVDLMIRQEKRFIITSQIGGDDYREAAKKYHNLAMSDIERIEALIKRIEETCRVVPFATATPAAGTDDQTF